MAAVKPTRVPRVLVETYDAITTVTDAFCREHLNGEYGELPVGLEQAQDLIMGEASHLWSKPEVAAILSFRSSLEAPTIAVSNVSTSLVRTSTSLG